ncbi:hypothetical protein CYY_004098 [Polysphondylium violaceum]|uniref:GH18 domain-containing protein n=1 Tax=Polysphondylium violaceum TaxID=133409 RepID=A0A8J4Q5Z9_9MYCE|nr:hypothetical protein CYY_004098 [Polysphondylium violaceum]
MFYFQLIKQQLFFILFLLFIIIDPSLQQSCKPQTGLTSIYGKDYYVWSLRKDVDFFNTNVVPNNVITTVVTQLSQLPANSQIPCVIKQSKKRVLDWVVWDRNFTQVDQSQLVLNNVKKFNADGLTLVIFQAILANESTQLGDMVAFYRNIFKDYHFSIVLPFAPMNYYPIIKMASNVDHIVLMAYDLGTQTNVIYPNSPYGKVRDGLNQYLAVSSGLKKKLILSLPLYAYWGNCTAKTNNLFSTNPCSVTNTIPQALPYSAIYSIINSPTIENSGTIFNTTTKTVMVNWRNDKVITNAQYDNPYTLYLKIKGLDIQGIGFFRLEQIIGVPEQHLNEFYYSTDSMNLYP